LDQKKESLKEKTRPKKTSFYLNKQTSYNSLLPANWK